jgi:hypothetical protein
VKASVFVKNDLHVARSAKAFILHTRFATQGKPEHNGNNHPIVSGNIVGVHNGHVSNDWGIFSQLGWDHQKAEVDSEAIFALLAHGNVSHKEALEELRGTIACAWLDAHDAGDILHVARVNSSPLIIAESELGSQVFASTAAAATDAMVAVGMTPKAVRTIEEGRLFHIRDGNFLDVESFTPARSYNTYSSWDSYDGGFRGATRVTRPVATTKGVLDKDTRHVSLVQTKDGDENGDIKWDAHDMPTLTRTAPQRHRFFKTDLFDHDYTVEYDASDYILNYAEREDAINYFYQQVSTAQDLTPDERVEIVNDAAYAMHGLLRPGDRVETTLHGHIVEGEVVLLPKTFPHGDYLLRLEVPVDGPEPNEHDTEFVLVNRTYELFYALNERKGVAPCQ